MTPELAAKIRAAIEEYDFARSTAFDKLTGAVNAMLCAESGHTIVQDHCGMRDHDFCPSCGKTAAELGYVWTPDDTLRRKGSWVRGTQA